MPSSLESRLHTLLASIESFARYGSRLTLRPYQLEIADAILDSVIHNRGLTFVVTLPRQTGKNEIQAQLEAYLLVLFSHRDVEMVSVSPTFRPQTLNAMERLQNRLDSNPLTRHRWHRHLGSTIRLGQARIHFFSGSPRANTVGATASLLLTIDEAQDILRSTYDRKFAPMVASAHATRLFWGTSWTSSTLLAREQRGALHLQAQDGIRRVWILTARDIESSHPTYAAFVRTEIDRLGRDHPFIKTQYFSEEIDAQLSMFNPTRLALIYQHPLPPIPGFEVDAAEGESSSPIFAENGGGARLHPESVFEGRRAEGVAFLLDVAGQDESSMSSPLSDNDDSSLQNPSRDSTTLSIVSIDLSTLETLRAPTYRVVHRQQWLGLNHLTIFGQLKNLVETWKPLHIVIDATGVGEGLWALLDKTFPTRVIPVKFTQPEKSEIGWHFLAIIETGRFRDLTPLDAVRLQYANCRSEVLPGPGKVLRWGVPDAARGPDGQLIHDDYLLADSLVAKLDTLPWSQPSHGFFIPIPFPTDDPSYPRHLEF